MEIKMRVGILGGAFDPVHCGHIALATAAHKIFQLDRVLFVPAYASPHKLNQPLTATIHRIAMLQLALKDIPEFSISDVEIKRKGVSYSIDTLKFIQKMHPETDFYLILGADTFLDLNAWKEFRQLITLCHIVVGNRPGFPFLDPMKVLEQIFGKQDNPYRQASKPTEFEQPSCGRNIFFFQMEPQDISSRNIRRGDQVSCSAKKILPPIVDQYIMKNQLYKEGLTLSE
ncbi:MAG: nicotinate (nicotinamide) nucleotide adenylyltransferase [Nitrospinae bacterium]|nr:nicotinate (nicotinamide) nucleotide adenylyltransferase [Nitrospinota bacterium]